MRPVEKYFVDGTPEEVSKALLLVADMGARAFGKRLETSLSDIRWALPLLSAPITKEETRMKLVEAMTAKTPVMTMYDKIAESWYINKNPRHVLLWGMALAEWRHRTKVDKRWSLALREEYVVMYSKGFKAFKLIEAPCARPNSSAVWGWTPNALEAGLPPRCYGRPVRCASKEEADDIVTYGERYLRYLGYLKSL